MNRKQTEHIMGIIEDFSDKAFHKYENGVLEHGGNLWDMPLMKLIENSQEEHIDGYVYTKTIQEILEFLLADEIIAKRVKELL